MLVRFAVMLLLVFTSVSIASADIIKKATTKLSESLEPAVRLVLSDKTEEARKWLNQYTASKKDQPHPDIILSKLLRSQGKHKESRQVLERLASTESRRMDVRIVFAEIAIAEARWFEAYTHICVAEKADPAGNWTPPYTEAAKRDVAVLKATCFEGQGNWGEALRIYKAMSQEQDVTPDLFGRMGRCSLRLKKTSDARRYFARAHELDRSLPDADLAVATHYAATGEAKEAERFFRMSLVSKRTGTHDRSRLAFGNWLIQNNRADEVSEVLQEPLGAKDAENGRSLLLAMAARMQGKMAESRNRLSALHQAAPSNFVVSNQLALVLIESTDEGYRGRAQQIAEANVRNFPRAAEAWSTLGWIQFRLGDTASAKQNLTRATSAGVISRDTAWQLAQVHERNGDHQEAQKFLAAARKSKGPFFHASKLREGNDPQGQRPQ